MALLAHSILPASIFDIDPWSRPQRYACKRRPYLLDILAPFDLPLDSEPRVPKKHRVTLDCKGYQNESIKTEIKDGKLIVTGSEGSGKADDADFSLKQFRKSFDLPKNIDADKLSRFMSDNGRLVVEIPLKPATDQDSKQQLQKTTPTTAAMNRNDGFPRIVQNDKGDKSVMVKLDLPKSIDPAKLSVTCKNRDLILKAESVEEKDDMCHKTYFYKRMTLPDETDIESLKCVCENRQLTISAQVVSEEQQEKKKIRIEYKQDAANQITH